MTATEINREIVSLTPEERTKVRAFLTHLERTSASNYLESIDRKIERMKAGHAVSAEELHQLNSILEGKLSPRRLPLFPVSPVSRSSDSRVLPSSAPHLSVER